MIRRLVLALVPVLLCGIVSAQSPGAISGAPSAYLPAVPAISAVVTGPAKMYPDPAISVVPGAPQVEDFPYITEEYFVTGRAGDAPYTTRIIVRRPRDPSQFSGTVVAEALHAGGRSLIFEWSRVSILTRRHLFVEIVHSPANVGLLKAFNAERYAPLAIAQGQTNEILAQVGVLVKSGAAPFAGYAIRQMTLMGTSASSGTVRGYFTTHAARRLADGRPIYDGFLLTSTNGNEPLPIVDVPIVQMPTQTEVTTWAEAGIKYRRPDSDSPGNRYRLYEVAGMPHNNSRENPGFLNDPCTLPVTDFPAGAFTALGLNYLVDWIANGKTPPHAPPIEVDQNPAGDGSFLALDEFGNAKGGIRNVYVDVPVAANGVVGKGKTAAQDRLCLLAGTKVPLKPEQLQRLYKSKDDYVSKVDRRLNQLVRRRLVPPRVRRRRPRRRARRHSALTSWNAICPVGVGAPGGATHRGSAARSRHRPDRVESLHQGGPDVQPLADRLGISIQVDAELRERLLSTGRIWSDLQA
jgi:hypothetical protein